MMNTVKAKMFNYLEISPRLDGRIEITTKKYVNNVKALLDLRGNVKTAGRTGITGND